MNHEKMSQQFIKRFAIIKNICLCQVDSSAFAQAGRHAPSTPNTSPSFPNFQLSWLLKYIFGGMDIFVDNLI